jgi:hypothetical protein
MAKGIDHEAVKGFTQMNKEHLLPAVCKALGIDMHKHPHHAARPMVFFEAGHRVTGEFEALYDQLRAPRRDRRRAS